MSTTPPLGRFLPGGLFPSLTQLPASHFSVGDVPAPTALYIGDDSFIRVSVKSVAVATTLTLRTRMIRSEDGQVTTSEDPIRPGQLGALQTFIVQLTEGFLLSAIVTADGGAIARGSVFVSVELCHGNPANTHRDALLIQDYVATSYAASWPGGQIRLSTEGPGTSTLLQVGSGGAGAEQSLAVAANQRARFVSLNVSFTTSAAVANRFPVFNFMTGANIIYSATVAAAIPASTVANISLGAGVGPATVVNNNHVIPIPNNLLLITTPQIVTATAGLQAGDQYGTISAIAETWIDA